jgi:hypothetical protein
MKTTLVLLAIVLLLGATAWGQPVPIGPASWINSDSSVTRAIGMGGTPTLNYQKSDQTWDFIVDDWVQVGNRQVWKSVRGNHRVFADSTGAAIYAKGNHYLGTQTTHLIKYNIGTKTWQTLKTNMPDSVTMSGRTITFHNIFPGIDKRLVNNAKVFQRYAETFIFHQQARDTITTAYGPWTGYLLGTATRLNVDSLNLSWKDAAGLFDITSAGRMTDGWVKGIDADTMVWTIAQSYLQTEDSTTSIVVHKRIVLLSGNPYLVELFNPVFTASLPAGDIWHGAVFGHQDIEGSEVTITNTYTGGVFAAPSTGVADSITIYANVTTAAKDARCSLYKRTSGGNSDQIDTTQEINLSVAEQWWTFDLQNAQTITSGDRYVLWAWSDGGSGDSKVHFGSSTGDTVAQKSPKIYAENTWADPIVSPTWNTNLVMTIYCTYTEAGAPAAGRRKRVAKLLGR